MFLKFARVLIKTFRFHLLYFTSLDRLQLQDVISNPLPNLAALLDVVHALLLLLLCLDSHSLCDISVVVLVSLSLLLVDTSRLLVGLLLVLDYFLEVVMFFVQFILLHSLLLSQELLTVVVHVCQVLMSLFVFELETLVSLLLFLLDYFLNASLLEVIPTATGFISSVVEPLEGLPGFFGLLFLLLDALVFLPLFFFVILS